MISSANSLISDHLSFTTLVATYENSVFSQAASAGNGQLFSRPEGSARESFRCIKSGRNHWKKVYRHQGVTTQVILRGFIWDLADSKELVQMLAVS